MHTVSFILGESHNNNIAASNFIVNIAIYIMFPLFCHLIAIYFTCVITNVEFSYWLCLQVQNHTPKARATLIKLPNSL